MCRIYQIFMNYFAEGKVKMFNNLVTPSFAYMIDDFQGFLFTKTTSTKSFCLGQLGHGRQPDLIIQKKEFERKNSARGRFPSCQSFKTVLF